MRLIRGLALILGTPVLWVVPVDGGDLRKIDRTIAKEPGYQGKPKYCLLVFGPEAKTCVWLVLAGDTLYVDRNGNGDLTETGKRFPLVQDEYARKVGRRVWEVGDIATLAGKVAYTGLSVCEVPEAASRVPGLGVGHGIAVNVPTGGTRVPQCAGAFAYAHHGFRLRFAARRQDAPVVHFGGPLRMVLLRPERLTTGMKAGVTYDLEARVGTPGLGKDAAALIDSDVPLGESSDARNPVAVAEVEFTDRQGRKQRLRERLVYD
jgi:hypothetical protein